MRKIFSFALALMLSSSVCVTAYAFSPVQAPILSASAVTPNVIILLDNSGSMNNAIAPVGVVAGKYGAVRYYNGSSREFPTDNTVLNNMYRGPIGDRCSTGLVALWGINANGTLGSRRCFALPDPVGGGLTRYTADYLSYIYHVQPNMSSLPMTIE